MFVDFSTFFTLWIIVLLMVSSTAYILFGELDAYETLYMAFVLHFESALGNWYNSLYDDLSLGANFGQAFHLISVLLNLVLMLNMVIAILMETYSRMAPLRRGLYYDTLTAQLPAYEYDNRWGVLILVPPPLNLFILPLVLIFWCLDINSDRVQVINEVFVKVAYFPVAIILTVVFMAANLLLIPLACFNVLFYKIWHVCCCCYHKKNFRARNSQSLKVTTSGFELTLFVVFGLPMLIISQLRDAYYHFKHLYTWNAPKLDNEKIRVIDYHSFIKFSIILKSEMKILNKRKAEMINREQELGKKAFSEESFLLRRNLIATKRLIGVLRRGLNIGGMI